MRDFFLITNLTQHLPSIVPPLKYNRKGLNNKGESCITSIAQGGSKAAFHESTIDYLNVASLKRLRINSEAVKIAKIDYFCGTSIIKNDQQTDLIKNEIETMCSSELKAKQKIFFKIFKKEQEIFYYKNL